MCPEFTILPTTTLGPGTGLFLSAWFPFGCSFVSQSVYKRMDPECLLHQLKQANPKLHGFLHIYSPDLRPRPQYPTTPGLSLGTHRPQYPHQRTMTSCCGYPQGEGPAGSSLGVRGLAGQGQLSSKGLQLGGAWVKPRCQFIPRPLTYFPVGEHSRFAHSTHMALVRMLARCPHVPSSGHPGVIWGSLLHCEHG